MKGNTVYNNMHAQTYKTLYGIRNAAKESNDTVQSMSFVGSVVSVEPRNTHNTRYTINTTPRAINLFRLGLCRA